MTASAEPKQVMVWHRFGVTITCWRMPWSPVPGLLQAPGRVRDAWGATNHAVDAVECFAQPRCNEARKRKLYQSLRVDGQGLIDLSGGTLAYDDAHVYRVRVIGRGQPLTLVIGDAVASGGDNGGSLAVRISKAK